MLDTNVRPAEIPYYRNAHGPIEPSFRPRGPKTWCRSSRRIQLVIPPRNELLECKELFGPGRVPSPAATVDYYRCAASCISSRICAIRINNESVVRPAFVHCVRTDGFVFRGRA